MIGLYFGEPWFKTAFGNQYGNIELDAVIDETHDWSAEATSNPVEEGAPVTDHVIDQADKLKIQGFITDAPIVISQSLQSSGTSTDKRTQVVFDLLYRLLRLKEVMTVYTKHRIYDNMVLTNVTIPRSAGVGEAIEFSAEFINIRKVSSQIVDVPAGISSKKEAKAGGASGSIAKKADQAKDGGKKQVETIQKPSSALSRILK